MFHFREGIEQSASPGALHWLGFSKPESPGRTICRVFVHWVKARQVLREQIMHRVNAPLTSSMERLFDAVAALAGVRETVNYEAQTAIEFEARVDPVETMAYGFAVYRHHPVLTNDGGLALGQAMIASQARSRS